MNMTISNVFNFINTFIEFLLIFFFFNKIFHQKYKPIYTISAYALFFLIVAILNLFIHIPLMNLLLFLITLFIIILFYEEKIYLKILSVFLFVLIIITADFITFSILSLFNQNHPFELFNSISYKIIGSTISKIFAFWLIVGTVKQWGEKVQLMSFVYILLILFIPISSVFVILSLFSLTIFANQSLNVLLVISVLIILSFNLITFFIFEIYTKKMHYNLLIELVNKQQENYKQIESVHEETRKMEHDINNHLQTLNILLHNKDFETINDYLYEIDESIKQYSYVSYSGNSVLDTILNINALKAKQKKIEFNVNLKITKPIQLSHMDCTVVFGNLLDNAFESCERINDPNIKKFIDIQITRIDSDFFIKISNTAQHVKKSMFFKDKFISLKEDSKYHGYGLKNIERVINKYNGKIFIEFKDGIFTVKILINDL